METEQKKRVRATFAPYLRVNALGPAELIGNRCKACGETYLGKRRVCLKCYSVDQMEEMTLGKTGELFTYTVVYQSAPWVKVPFVAGVVRLPEGPFVTAVLEGVEPSSSALRVGMKLEFLERVVHHDAEGSEIVAYAYRPASA